MAQKFSEVRDLMINGLIYGVMKNPKNAASKSHVRMAPEVFMSKEQAKKYIEESRRRGFLRSDQLVIVEMRIVGGEFNETIL